MEFLDDLKVVASKTEMLYCRIDLNILSQLAQREMFFVLWDFSC